MRRQRPPPCFVVFQLVMNQIRRCNECIWENELHHSRLIGAIYLTLPFLIYIYVAGFHQKAAYSCC